jgi:hypothetical protein
VWYFSFVFYSIKKNYNVDMPFLGLYVGVCWKYNVVYEDAAQMKPSSYYIIFLILGDNFGYPG